jgi:hypothetical protein
MATGLSGYLDCRDPEQRVGLETADGNCSCREGYC